MVNDRYRPPELRDAVMEAIRELRSGECQAGAGEWEFTREWVRKTACGPGTIWTRLVSGGAGAGEKPYATSIGKGFRNG
jgi:hypothetical protein